MPGWKHLPGKVVGIGTIGLLPGGEDLFGIVTDRSMDPATIYVAKPAGVWKSADMGRTWLDFNSGLPNSPQCTDLRIVREASGVTFLYVATFGWSTLRLPLGWDVVLKPVSVTGHMDLTDRVAIGKDVIAHPTFADTRMLGPLHPIDEMIFVEDDGEFRVRLTLHLQWSTDFSVTLNYVAQLIDNSDNSVQISHSGGHTIVLGSSDKVTIHLKTGDLFPDRAYIECIVANG